MITLYAKEPLLGGLLSFGDGTSLRFMTVEVRNAYG